MAIDTYFQNIADAIRQKSGTSGLLTPAQMPQAILDIPSGGGGHVPYTPSFAGFSYAGMNNGVFTEYNASGKSVLVYELNTAGAYVLVPAVSPGRMIRAGVFYNKTYSDFEYYITHAGTNGTPIYTEDLRIANTTSNLQYRRVFTTTAAGVVVIQTDNHVDGYYPAMIYDYEAVGISGN